jgi:anhydro-N-acetylmuramic acid kinase
MIVAGVMSGTSADGINVALVRITERARSAHTASGSGPGRVRSRHIELLGHAEFPFAKAVRAAVLASMNARRASVAELARLNFLLGDLYGSAVLETQRWFKTEVELVGCHGQTLYHQGAPATFLGREVSATWQTGEAAVTAAKVGAPVISDFRPADMAAGGKGAPLVPFLDFALFRDARVGRIVQNIGGIANLTAIPARASADEVIAFDTGPGNMVIDAVTEQLFRQPFDADGRLALAGKVREQVLKKLLAQPFFRNRPPKTAGREEFGREFVREFLRLCGKIPNQDVVATATALTARSIAHAIRDFVVSRSASMRGAGLRRPRPAYAQMILSGGGAKNPTLVRMLSEQLRPLGITVRLSNDFGIPSETKEAVAFALLAYETWHGRPSNVPSATGARRPAVLGKISYP